MDTQELLSEEESAHRAGVSVSTLRQFADFGFLTRFDENGEGRYRFSDLVAVFSLTEPTPTPNPDEPVNPLTASSGEGEQAPEMFQAAVDEEPATPDVTPQFARGEVEPVDGETRLADQVEVVTDAPGANIHGEGTADSERDDRLGTTYELLALNKRLREELKVAHEERDWLRVRLEKLEARTERDQMLLLAESQTIRQLVSQVEKEKRSIWSLLALPWSGNQTK